MRRSPIRKLLPLPAANSSLLRPSACSLTTRSPTPKPREPPVGMRFTLRAPARCVRNFKSTTSSLAATPDITYSREASFAGGVFQPFAVDNGDALSADVKDARVLQLIERIGDRFTIYAEALGEVLMRQSLHFIPFRRA